MRINNKEHLKLAWRVHSLLPDFTVEDTWLLPMTLKANESIQEVQLVFAQAMHETATRGMAGLLFKFRFFLGRVFGWEDPVSPVSALPEGSIRARYAEQESLQAKDFTSNGFGGFVPVYHLEMEILLEIENKTVLAACHLGKVQLGPNDFGVHMTIYVKPKGRFGKFYMQLIKPFRLFIVYPALLKMVGKQWKRYKS
ncbi:MAG: DUF2867 domain-containing protein [Bacteroidetes bacterium]|nr:DUF2867 domain-containing protein [Bacteroidota bacterium]